MKQKKKNKREMINHINSKRDKVRAKTRPLRFDELQEELHKSALLVGKIEESQNKIAEFEKAEKDSPGYLDTQPFINMLVGYAILKQEPPEWILKNYYCHPVRSQKLVMDMFKFVKPIDPEKKQDEQSDLHSDSQRQ